MADNQKQIDEIEMDASSLFREETITDLKTGTIKVLHPIKADGSEDTGREPMFVCQTELMSNAGVIPVSAKIEAATLAEAIEKFPAAVKQAVDDMMKRVQEYQREQANRIVTPGEMAGGMGGPGGPGAKPGGGLIV